MLKQPGANLKAGLGVRHQLRRGVAAALAEVLIDHALGGIFAATAAAAHGELVLYIEKRTRTAIDSLTDVFIGHGMAYADVH
jgi:hypothetical protein